MLASEPSTRALRTGISVDASDEQRPVEPTSSASNLSPQDGAVVGYASAVIAASDAAPGSSDYPAEGEVGMDLSDLMKDETLLYICRYGAGCTHRREKVHRTHFWHPTVPRLDADTVRSNFMCYECGEPFPDLPSLRTHLSQKNAWSNRSLVGCKVVCLTDKCEWEEALVMEYHKSGKHHLHFYLIGEKKWMHMRKTVFYIIARPVRPLNMEEVGEVKEDDDDDMRLRRVGKKKEKRDGYNGDNISMDFAFAQSVLFKLYGCKVQETGYKTIGHQCLTDLDKQYSQEGSSSFLYGEFLPRGVDMGLAPDRMNAGVARVLFDLGMGTGKVLLQAFLQFRNLRYVYGVEISQGRYKLAEAAALRMVELLGYDRFEVDVVHGQRISIREILPESAMFDRYGQHVEMSAELPEPASIRNKKFKWKPRILHMVCGDLLQTEHIHFADIVMLETDFPESINGPLCQLLAQMKSGARALTYIDLRKAWPSNNTSPFGAGLGLGKVIGSSSVAPSPAPSGLALGSQPFRQMDFNRSLSDRYPTTWSVRRGHHFFVWRKKMPSEASILSADESACLRSLASLDLDADAAEFNAVDAEFGKGVVGKEDCENGLLDENDVLDVQLEYRGFFGRVIGFFRSFILNKPMHQIAPIVETSMEAPDELRST